MRDAGSHSGTCDPADCCCQSGHCPGMKKASPISLETGCTAYLAVLFQTRISGLSASAASQHLSRMKSEGLIEGVREAKFIRYHIKNEAVLDVVKTLKNIYCPGE